MAWPWLLQLLEVLYIIALKRGLCTPSSDGNQLFMVILENTIGICLQVNFWLYLFSFLIELLFKFSIVLGYLEKSMSQQGVYDVVDRYSAYLTYFFYLLLL